MPVYDVKCSDCGLEDSVRLSFQEVDAWDAAASCPRCAKGEGSYRRIIKPAAFRMSGQARPAAAALKSGEKDDMRHKAESRRNPDAIAAAVESVRKGEFEGF